MNKLAPYFQIPGTGEDVLDAWPGLDSALFMDIGPDRANALHWNYPLLKICLRLYEGGLSWQTTTPEDWAARFYPVHPEYAISWTLPLGQDDRGLFAAFDDWSVRFAVACRKEGIEPVGLCVGTGNFTAAADRVKVSEAFPGICETYDILGPHDYGWPDLQSQVYWHALRWTAWHDDIKEKFDREMTFMPMECGLTQAVLEGRPDLGWQSGADGVTDESYVASMRWYNEMLCQIPYVYRAFVYLFHGYGDWETFDHVKRPEVWHKIRDFDAAGEPPNGGNEMEELKVYDLDGNLLTGSAAQDKIAYHGLTITQPTLANGQDFLQLVKLEEREGPACFIFTVLKADGTPWEGAETAWAWADNIGDADDILGNNYPTDWQQQADVGPTKVDGTNAPGFGKTGWYHGPYESGPGRAWIRHPEYWSTRLTGIGMEAGTSHRTMYGTWKLTTYQGTPDIPPSTDDPATELRQIATRLNAIAAGLGQGTPAKIIAVYPNGSQIEYKPSLVASAIARARAFLRK